MRDVVRHGHVREEPDLLDHVADPAPELDDVLVADARPVDRDVTRVELDSRFTSFIAVVFPPPTGRRGRRSRRREP